MADPLRVGIIGANPTSGWAARAHLPGFKAGIPGLKLAAVSTTKQESADQAAKEFGADAAFDDHLKMLAADVIDIGAVVVKLPHHYALAKDIIEAGKHIYVEWPLGTDTAQAEELTALAKSKGVRTAIGLQGHHSADYKHMRKLIDEGFVGEVLAVSMTQYQTGAMLLMLVSLGIAANVMKDYGGDWQVAKTLPTLGWDHMTVLEPALATLVRDPTVVSFRTKVLPAWLGWLGMLLVIAPVLVEPVSITMAFLV